MIDKYQSCKEKKESIMTKNETTSAIVLARKKLKREIIIYKMGIRRRMGNRR